MQIELTYRTGILGAPADAAAAGTGRASSSHTRGTRKADPPR